MATALRILAWWGLASIVIAGLWSLSRRRHPGDVADLATIQTQLDHERQHSARLARQLAESHELTRKLVQGQDSWRAEARRLSGEVVALKAQLRAEAS